MFITRTHIVSSSSCIVSGVTSQLVLTADPIDVLVGHGEIRRKHSRGQFMAISAVTGERIDDTVKSL
jgi:hypothetical protein